MSWPSGSPIPSFGALLEAVETAATKEKNSLLRCRGSLSIFAIRLLHALYRIQKSRMSHSFQISVVIPVFNGERFLAEAIESVLNQKLPDVEILVVDDGSTDGTAAVAAQFGERIRFLQQSNQGAAAARNHGIRLAKSDVLAFLDADDLFTSDALDLQLQRLRKNPDVGIILGQRMYFSTPAPHQETNTANLADEHLFMSFGCAVIRRSVFDTIGLLSESMRFCEDWDWFMRAREARIRLLIHRHLLLQVRLHDSNSTRQREAGQKYILEMFRRSLARRKAGNAPAHSLPPLSSFFEPDDKVVA